MGSRGIYLACSILFFGLVCMAKTTYSGTSEFGFKYYTFNDLVHDVRKAKAKTVFEGLQVIPQEFFDSFTLIKSGTALQSSTPENPRALLYGNSGHLLITFNGDASQNAHASLETAEFDEKSKKILFRSIVFKAEHPQEVAFFAKKEIAYEDKRILVTTGNPHICAACHSVKRDLNIPSDRKIMRYNWAPFKKWSFAFGENGDTEDDRFESRKLKWVENPRYRRLFPKDKVAGTYPYLPSGSPNAKLTALMGIHYAQQMAPLILADPELGPIFERDRANFCEGRLESYEFETAPGRLEVPTSYLRLDRDFFYGTAPFKVGAITSADLVFLMGALKPAPSWTALKATIHDGDWTLFSLICPGY